LQWLERLRQQVAELRVELPTTQLSVTVSIGLASPAIASPQAAAQINAALRMADEALYRAKREGKNRVALPLPVAA
jgi:diguanylate cyclase (GGDEF)-like protein